jgi:hypothetical protein
VPQSAPEFVPQSAPEFVPQSVKEFVPQSVKEFVPQSVKEFVPQSVKEFVPQSVKEFVPQDFYPHDGQAALTDDQGYNEYYDQMDGYMNNMNLGDQSMTNTQRLDAYFYNRQQQQPFPRQVVRFRMYNLKPLYHLYNSSAPLSVPKGLVSIHAYSMSNQLREDLSLKNEDLQRVGDPNNPILLKLNERVQSYHSFCPIDVASAAPSIIFGYRNSLFKAINSSDGGYYLLRRIEGLNYST